MFVPKPKDFVELGASVAPHFFQNRKPNIEISLMEETF